MNGHSTASIRDEGPSTIIEIESDSDLRQTENEGLSQPSAFIHVSSFSFKVTI